MNLARIFFFFHSNSLRLDRDGASRTNGERPTFVFFLWGDQYTIFFFFFFKVGPPGWAPNGTLCMQEADFLSNMCISRLIFAIEKKYMLLT
jgi:hypothetical protein